MRSKTLIIREMVHRVAKGRIHFEQSNTDA